ncbi:FKBP-type peptidyl-prolyl cis-trans isomerase [bacterium]|nr:FKBP-type peptidyl-prolyl cis-trans isomerase [bacterium]
MKFNLLFVLLITTLGFVGCSGDDEECNLMVNIPTSFNQTVFQDNIATIENYLSANGLTAQKTASGLYYIINEEGSLAKPELCDDVSVAYRGYLVNGTTFDSSNGEPITFPLTGVIFGWQEGIQLFGKEGNGVLLIPSYLAYGNSSPSPLIPGNSALIFDVTLDNF